MTRNLKLFALFSLIWSVAFFSILHWALFDPENRWPTILTAAISYGLGFALMGFLLGKNDLLRHTRRNLGLWYYGVSQIASLLVGGIWILFWKAEEIETLTIMSVIFAFFLAVAALTSRKKIKGIEKEKLFK